jgi:uncharacterized protein YjiS (DUF1127 family)
MDTKTVLKIISLPISKLPERHSRYRVHPVDDGTVQGPSFNRETENANQPFQATDGAAPLHRLRRQQFDGRPVQPSNSEVSSLRQVMRFAARFNAVQPPEALISVYRHMNGADPKLVAKRLVADRFWKYVEVPVILHTLLRGYRAWKRRVAERRELMQLADRELADIGISRSEIDRVVSQEIAELR